MFYRTIWISDMHLGTRGCSADQILKFLRENDSETLYLVGDIIDGWRLYRKFYWPQSHNDIVQKILRKARKGTKVVLIPGNHDEFLRQFTGHHFGGIDLKDEDVHVTAKGMRLLVIHGDQFDGITKYHKWLALLGDISYVMLLWVNRWLMKIRRAFGCGHWSLSAYVKHNVKQAVNFIGDYEATIAEECKQRGFDGIVCGHIHHAEMRVMNGILYCNDGDWVESCTALVEDFEGNLSIVRTHE